MCKLYLLCATFLLSFVSIGQNDDPRKALNYAMYPFYHGVASGDPLHDRVILWTRVTDDTLSVDSVMVNWRVATDTGMSNIVSTGSGYAKADDDWCFKVDAAGLNPYTWYYYDFQSLGQYSIRGRTKTAPLGDVDSVRLAIVSCARYHDGYYEAYEYIRNRNDLDGVVHLGDYIYEKGGGSNTIGRPENVPAHEIVTLEDYRLRYSHYRLDDDLRRLHQQLPFITVWDDHEGSNNGWSTGAEDHDPGTEGPWIDRINNAGKAYHEWLPIRSPDPASHSIYRKLQYGDLIDLYMIDSRYEARDEMVPVTSSDIDDPSRTMLGNTQFSWLTTDMAASTAKWRIIGNQVMMAPLEMLGQPVNNDQWDGYRAERTKLFNYIDSASIDNFVVLTGDIHTSWVNDLPHSSYDASTCTGSVGVEYVVPSVTTQNGGVVGGLGVGPVMAANDHMRYVNLSDKGYVLLHVSKTRMIGHYYYMNDITSSGNGEQFVTAWYVQDGTPCAVEQSFEIIRPGPKPDFAPDEPAFISDLPEQDPSHVVFGTYPNPFYNELSVQLYMYGPGDVSVEVYDLSGRVIMSDQVRDLGVGLNYITLFFDDIANGQYQLIIKGKNHIASRPILRM